MRFYVMIGAWFVPFFRFIYNYILKLMGLFDGRMKKGTVSLGGNVFDRLTQKEMKQIVWFSLPPYSLLPRPTAPRKQSEHQSANWRCRRT